MAATEKVFVRVLVDYVHDLAFGLFPGTVLAAWTIRRAAELLGSGQAAVSRAAGSLWMVMLLGLAVSVTTGLIRLRYWKLPVRAESVQSKAQMAATKHSAFVLTILVSAVALYTIVT